MGRVRGVARFEGSVIFYEGMPIDYLNNDRSHDWINLQTKIYTFLTKSTLFDKISIFQDPKHHSGIFMNIFEVQNPHLSLS